MKEKKFNLSIAVSYFVLALWSDAQCMEDNLKNTYKLEIKTHKVNGEKIYYTDSYRPHRNRGIKNFQTPYSPDKRQIVNDTNEDAWKVHGQLEMDFDFITERDILLRPLFREGEILEKRKMYIWKEFNQLKYIVIKPDGEKVGRTLDIDIRSQDLTTEFINNHQIEILKQASKNGHINEHFIGSGTLISPYHVLTAGHNLFDPDKKVEAENINFYAGRNGSKNIASAKSAKAYIFKNWDNGDKEYDMGIIVLDRPIGNDVGWNGLLCSSDSFLYSLENITVSGYAGDKPHGTMWFDKAKIYNVTEEQLGYELSTAGGESGSNPWIYLDDPQGYYSLGAHAYGFYDGEKYNRATRLTEGKFRRLVEFISTGQYS